MVEGSETGHIIIIRGHEFSASVNRLMICVMLLVTATKTQRKEV